MKQKPVITIIGAASTTFGPRILRDMFNIPAVGGSTVRFVDINAERLEIYTRLANKINEYLDDPCIIEATTDRKAALKGSNYVILSVDTGHYSTWEQDFKIPVNNGVRQILGELGGLGGLFHSLRQIPLHLQIAQDIAELCPNALVMVTSNPLNRICLAMQRYGGLKNVVGLCHGVEMSLYLFLNRVMEVEGDDMEAVAAGTNHLTWILDLRRKADGEDLYPLLKDSLRKLQTDEQMLSRTLLDVYGYFPGTLDSHAGEYIPYAYEFARKQGIDFDAHRDQEQKRWIFLRELAEGEQLSQDFEALHGSQGALSRELQIENFFAKRNWTDTLAMPIIAALESNQHHRMPALNLLNDGQIDNLPRGVFVETPCVVDSSGMHPITIGRLPAPLAAFCRRDIDQMELTVEAGVSGNRNLVLQAMLLDPVVDHVGNARRAMDSLFKENTPFLPQFA
jgi:alpha-galactosidase